MLNVCIVRSCAAALLCAPPLLNAQVKEPPKPAAPSAAAAQKQPAAPTKPQAKPPQKSAYRPPRGPIEKLDCKIGTEDNHARIAVLAQGGDVQSLAYYSKWKPRTCSVHLQRGDAYSRWNNTGDATGVTTEFGDVLIQEKKTEYRFIFREVDRMHYCGMMGKLNGSMTITRGPKRTCTVEGIMDRNESEREEAERAEEKAASPEPSPLPAAAK